MKTIPETQTPSAPCQLRNRPVVGANVLLIIVFGLGITVAAQAQTTPPPDDAPTVWFEQNQQPVQMEELPPQASPGLAPVVPPPLIGNTWIAQGPNRSELGQVESVTPDDEVVGAIHTVIAHPTNADILYIGATNGGIWKTTNATNATPVWTPLTDDKRSPSIGAMAFDPTDATRNTIIAGIGRFSSFSQTGGDLHGLLLTTDGGTTFTEITDPVMDEASISGVAKRGNTILATGHPFGGAVDTGLFRSADGGASWTNLSGAVGSGLPAGGIFDLVEDSNELDDFYVSVQSVGIFYSSDAGATWTNISSGDATLDGVITMASNNNTEMAVSSTDVAVPPIAPTVAPASHGRLYASVIINGQPQYIGFTDDQGTNWTAMDLPQTQESNGDTEGLSPRVKPGGQGAIHFSIAVSPTTATTVYVAGDRQDLPFPNFIGANDFTGRIFRGDTTVSPTGGVPSPQWEHLTHSDNIATIAGGGTTNDSAPHADSREMVFDANGDIVQVDDGGIYRRTSPGDNTGDWFSLNNLQVTEMHDVAYDTVSNIIISGNQDTGTTQQKMSGGMEWTSVSTADGGDVAVDDTTIPGMSQRYSSFQFLGRFRKRTYDANNVLQSENFPNLIVGGFFPLESVDFNIQFVQRIELNAVDQSRGVLGTANLYETNDKFENLTDVSGFTGFFITATAYGCPGPPANADLLYYGDTSSSISVRTIGGGPFSATTYPGDIPIDIVIDPTDCNTVFAIDSNQVFVSNDQGAIWRDITGNLANLAPSEIDILDLRNIEFIPYDNSIVVGGRDGVFHMLTSNEGVWSRLGMGLPNAPVFDLDYDANDGVLVAGTLGRGAWLLPIALDYGDAPDPLYPTLFASDGARHVLGSGLFLGLAVDAETEGQPTASADGDDVNGDTPDDEDGVSFTTPLLQGQQVNVDVTASLAGGKLNAWVDFNNNGSWADAGEQIFTDQPLAAGVNNLSFMIPANAVSSNPTYSRFRLDSSGGLSFTGQAGDGEVEDYALTIGTAADLSIMKMADPNPVVAGNTFLYTVTVKNTGPGDAQNVIVTNTLPTGVTFITTVGCNNDPAGVPNCELGTIASGGMKTFTIQATVDNDTEGVLTNQATVTSDTADPDATNNSITEDTTVVALPSYGAGGANCTAANNIQAGNLVWDQFGVYNPSIYSRYVVCTPERDQPGFESLSGIAQVTGVITAIFGPGVAGGNVHCVWRVLDENTTTQSLQTTNKSVTVNDPGPAGPVRRAATNHVALFPADDQTSAGLWSTVVCALPINTGIGHVGYGFQ